MPTTPITILNGPNLNLLGTREPEIYGDETLSDIEQSAKKLGASLNLEVICHQTNSEGTLVDLVQAASQDTKGIIINAGAYSHTSIAIHDALMAAKLPKIEVHLSNIHAREEFRHHSWLSAAVDGFICGFGAEGYNLALTAIAKLVNHP